MQRFTYDDHNIIDHDTGERLSTLDQCLDKLNDLNALIDMEVHNSDSKDDHEFAAPLF